jgi:hypothetical protein
MIERAVLLHQDYDVLNVCQRARAPARRNCQRLADHEREPTETYSSFEECSPTDAGHGPPYAMCT